MKKRPVTWRQTYTIHIPSKWLKGARNVSISTPFKEPHFIMAFTMAAKTPAPRTVPENQQRNKIRSPPIVPWSGTWCEARMMMTMGGHLTKIMTKIGHIITRSCWWSCWRNISSRSLRNLLQCPTVHLHLVKTTWNESYSWLNSHVISVEMPNEDSLRGNWFASKLLLSRIWININQLILNECQWTSDEHVCVFVMFCAYKWVWTFFDINTPTFIYLDSIAWVEFNVNLYMQVILFVYSEFNRFTFEVSQ